MKTLLIICIFASIYREVYLQTACGVNEVYKQCGSACPASCKSPSPICTAQCIPGCFCIANYVKNDNGICIHRRRCPSNPNPTRNSNPTITMKPPKSPYHSINKL